MKDLKYLAYFENELLEVKNDLVNQAIQDGKVMVGNLCNHIPEPLVNLPGCVSIRLRAPRTTSMEMGTYYMTSLLCEYCRSLLERSLEGGYQFYDCLITPFACGAMSRFGENFELLKCQGEDKKKFFVSYVEVPMKSDDNGLSLLVKEMKLKLLDKLHDTFGIDTSDAAIRQAVKEHNELCEVLEKLGEFRKEENPRITGYEFAVFCCSSFCLPHYLILDKLKETLEEVSHREKDPDKEFHKKYRARVGVVGSEIDDPDFIKLIEDSGALVVADRYCFGSLPGREVIELNETEDALTQVCRHYIKTSQCPRFMDTAKIKERPAYLMSLAKEYKADGLIIEQMKFCDYWGYERTSLTHLLSENEHYPVLSVDRPYIVGNSGQMRTRVQAFVESIEIKKIDAKEGR
jgi:benzoyl-CoA reductase/2-hydroxyglutaryl-CoA dehydratase subunit BcrC/BadD/HgdB